LRHIKLASLIRALKSFLISGRSVGVRLHRIWHNLGHLYQHWLINIFFGVVIEVVLIMAHNSIIVVAVQNWALDAAMRGSAELATTSDATTPSLVTRFRRYLRPRVDDAPPHRALAFVDVDEEAWRSSRWGGGEPFRAPRDGLIKLIKYAFDNGASYVILDVIVEGHGGSATRVGSPTCCAAIAKKYPCQNGCVDQDDQTFSDQIVGLEDQLKPDPARLKPDQYLLLVRTLREPLAGMEQLAPELRTSPVDQALRDHPTKRILMVAPYFQVSRDGVLRDWQLWRAGCRRDTPDGRGHWEILPSVQLAISALELASNEKKEKGARDGDAFPWWTAATCPEPCVVDLAAFAKDGAGLPAKDTDRSVWDWLHKQTELTGAKDLTPPSDDAIELTNRIFFSYRYPAPSNVHVIPAIRILEPASPKEDKRLADGLSKSIVVIGQSFEAARDQRMTPLGAMPGAMVLVNSLNSMLEMQLLQPPSKVAEWMFLGVSIFVIGFIFARFTSLGATVVLLLTFVPALIIVNYLLLSIHIWMDFAVPLLGIFAHRTIAVIEDWVVARRHAGVPRSHD
jgi:hypothetical protein